MRWCESKRNYSLFDQINSYLLHRKWKHWLKSNLTYSWYTCVICQHQSAHSVCCLYIWRFSWQCNLNWRNKLCRKLCHSVFFKIYLFIIFILFIYFFLAYFLEYIKYMYVYVCTRFSLSSRNRWFLDLSSLWITFKYLGNVTKSKLR